MYASDPGYEMPLPIYRCNGAGSYDFLSLQRSLHGVKQHWAGRSIPCPGESCCPICEGGVAPRFVGYIVVRDRAGCKKILEVPHNSHAPFREQEQRGELLGSIIAVQRSCNKSAWITQFPKRVKISEREEVSGEDLLDALCRIHELPRRRGFQKMTDWRKAIEEAAIRKLQIVAEKPTF